MTSDMLVVKDSVFFILLLFWINWEFVHAPVSIWAEQIRLGDFYLFFFFLFGGVGQKGGEGHKSGELRYGRTRKCVWYRCIMWKSISNNKNMLVTKIQDKICKKIQEKTAWKNYLLLRKLDIFMFTHRMIEAYHFHWFPISFRSNSVLCNN